MAALTDPLEQVRRPSPGLNLNLSSNNPFRNPRTASPAGLSPGLPSPAGVAPRSPGLSPTNPFLAAHEQNGLQQHNGFQQQTRIATTEMSLPAVQTQQQRSPMDHDTAKLFRAGNERASEQLKAYIERATIDRERDLTWTATHESRMTMTSPDQMRSFKLFVELFANYPILQHRLTLVDTGGSNDGPAPAMPPPPTGHKPSRSDEPSERRRGDPRMVRPRPRPEKKEELDIFASPEKQARPDRPRRNSDTSIMSKSEDDRRRRERRRREAERTGASGERRGSENRDGSRARPKRKPRGMDLIDRLDQTGIYGAGFFHHDGPFDAVNPHRNRPKNERAPMRAFPVGSANMVLGGSGPLNKGIDLERFHGKGAEGFTDYSAGAMDGKKKSVLSFDPLARVDPVHGEESYGLGTSTFLEGAPASRKAIQRRESETNADVIQGMGGGGGGGLQRKKSLAQRIRGMSRKDYADGERPVIGAYQPRTNGAGSPENPAIPERLVQSAGGPGRARGRQNEANPFDTMYDDAFDKKGAAIKIAEQERDGGRNGESSGRPRAPSSPMRNQLERRATVDSSGDSPEPKTGGGFLNRVKSLKGGRRGRVGS